MSDFKGTPGPWELRTFGGELTVIRKGSLKKLSGLTTYQPVATDIYKRPDAKLITASPELLEVCILLLEMLDAPMTRENDFPRDVARHKATRVIAKALGKKV